MKERVKFGEKVGGGYFVFRRGKKTGRIATGNTLPLEHPSLESAQKEAVRLAGLNEGETFAVLYQVFDTASVS